MQHKTALLIHLLKQSDVQKSVIFVRKRERVHELATWLREAGINTCYLEGEMVQAKRNEAVKRMMDGRVNVLVATDVAARGLDILDITHVFNFDMPRTADTYLHRIGRTGRAGRKGTAISLVEAHDHLLLGKVGRYLNEPLKARVIDELRPKTKVPNEKSNGKPSKKVLAKRAEDKAKNKEKAKVKCAIATPKTSANAVRRRPNRPATRNNHRRLRKTAFTGGFYGRLRLPVVRGQAVPLQPFIQLAELRLQLVILQMRRRLREIKLERDALLVARPGIGPGLQQQQRQVRRVNLRRQMQRSISQPIAQRGVRPGRQQQPQLLLTPGQHRRRERRGAGNGITHVHQRPFGQQQPQVLRVLQHRRGVQRAVAVQPCRRRVGAEIQQRLHATRLLRKHRPLQQRDLPIAPFA